jgi:nitrate reductase NapE component
MDRSQMHGVPGRAFAAVTNQKQENELIPGLFATCVWVLFSLASSMGFGFMTYLWLLG